MGLPFLSHSRTVVTLACVLLVGHIASVVWLGTAENGALLSDLIQLALGILVFLACFSAASRSTSFTKYFWKLTACSFAVWTTAQAYSTYGDVVNVSMAALWTINILFSFWFVPFAMALLLDSNYDFIAVDGSLILDFGQAVLFCLVAYFYFFYLPRSESTIDLAHSVWQPYFVGYGLLATTFVIRSFSAQDMQARFLFRRMGFFLLLSGAVDAFYYYGPGQELKTGAWFDLLWSALLFVPLITAVRWKGTLFSENPKIGQARARGIMMTRVCALLFPLLTLIMCLGIGRQRFALAAPLIVVVFVTSSARLLFTHHDLLQAQEALRHEALHDGLTGLLNRKAIHDRLFRELERSQRTGSPLGVFLADVDHFKRINDTHGHAAGDLVLRIVASEIASALRPYDAVGRYGGEEFLIVAPGCDFNQTWALAERVRLAIATCAISIKGRQQQLTISLGVATGEELTSEAVLHVADEALYKAKRDGRNRVEPTPDRRRSEPDTVAPAGTHFWI